ncbi:hypothetical protein LshimejAT787_0409020 [Lyophyllum shimeji]|uniref:Uncharacterized protein n=1 Tax=Lyophyllum shimeji TaxID=47721 RepID=A0A9P3PLF7_LYOSH|nr:hypothetical protein LshimejAT787_0409020 [Lyophyllum shimeji]
MDRLPPNLSSTGKDDLSTPHTTTVSSRPASPSTFHPTSPKHASSAPLLNIQFHISSVTGLPLAGSWHLTRRLTRRVVHVSCTGAGHDADRRSDAVAEADSTWDENLEQIGPVVATDKITFSVEEHATWPVKRGTRTIATSKEYTVDALLVLQGKRGEKKSITIPLRSGHDKNADANLVLRVREPTTDFVSKQWKEEAEMWERRREGVEMQ